MICEKAYNTDDLKRLCIERKIVTVAHKLNPKRDKSDILSSYLVDRFKAPLKIAIDILFLHNGLAPKCKFCNEELDMNDLSNYKPINYAHVLCAKNDRKNKIDWKTSIEKRKETCLERFGSETYFDYHTMVIKTRKTKFERYGDSNYVNSEKAMATKQRIYGDANYRNDEKIKKTCQQRYGASNPFGSAEIIKKSSCTMEARYGGRGFASEEIKSKIEDTNILLYGTKKPMCNTGISKKSSEAKRKKYYGSDLYETLTADIELLYDMYVSDNKMSLNKLADSIGIDRNTLSRNFKSRGFEVLDRNYFSSRSAGEDYLYNMIKDIMPDIEIIRNDRKILAPKEIDLWIPSHNVGIEYHGSYWHQEDKVRDLHRQKANVSIEKNIRLIQIFDYELVEKNEQIKSLIKSALGIFDHKIFARKCSLEVLSAIEARSFCDENHLQGYGAAKFNYALVHPDHGIVQLLSFAKPRFSKKHEWEIIRSCSKSGFIITGGMKKLWSRFLNEQKPNSVITYADARFFDGSSYERNLGFQRIGHSGSNYMWSNGIEKLSRYKTQKNKLVENGANKENSENEIMSSKGFYKILDAGNHVFEWKN
jgi:hypothetical protein